MGKKGKIQLREKGFLVLGTTRNRGWNAAWNALGKQGRRQGRAGTRAGRSLERAEHCAWELERVPGRWNARLGIAPAFSRKSAGRSGTPLGTSRAEAGTTRVVLSNSYFLFFIFFLLARPVLLWHDLEFFHFLSLVLPIFSNHSWMIFEHFRSSILGFPK